MKTTDSVVVGLVEIDTVAPSRECEVVLDVLLLNDRVSVRCSECVWVTDVES